MKRALQLITAALALTVPVLAQNVRRRKSRSTPPTC